MFKTFCRTIAALAIAMFLALTVTSTAMAQAQAPEPPSRDGIGSSAQSVQFERAQGDATQGYGQCPYGRACLFSGWHGTGMWGYAEGCGWWELGYKNDVSSVKTHGNAVWLYDVEADAYSGYIPPWTQTNLSAAENNRADHFYVVC